tara:strand:+ start:323 stop:676 length:354 start_codon:yes stop_codon:yes gene_type:complete
MQKIVVDDYIYLPNVVDEEDPFAACQRLIHSGEIKPSHRIIEIGSIFCLISASTYHLILEDITGQTDVCLLFQNGAYAISHIMNVCTFANIKSIMPLPDCVELQSIDMKDKDWVIVS